MKFLKKLVKPLVRFALKLKAKQIISRLRNSSDPYKKMLGDILKETLENDITQEEKVWKDKIELLKNKLESSTDKISFIDYGARKNPNPNVFDQEIEKEGSITTTVGAKCKGCSELYTWVLICFKLIRKFKPSSCIELGTCMGISASFQASALHLNGKGKMITMEGANSLASIAKKNFQTLGLNNIEVAVGRFQDILYKVLSENGPIDYAFIDGHLDGVATLDYFGQIISSCKNKAVLIIDNISWSQGMKNAWKIIEADERVKISLYLRQLGICILDSERVEKQSFSIPLY